jgi:hypothetical protein
LLIKTYSNNIFIGSARCLNGSYSLKADLFSGKNNLYAQDFDSLGQGGPLSNTVSVNYISTQHTTTQSQVNITSSYGEIGANPGQQLNWPVIISGGTPPYAISTDWGDGQPSTLQSSASAGSLTLKHVYSSSGVYAITITVSDSKGSTAFLQLVGMANGQVIPIHKTKVASNNIKSNTNSQSMSWGLLGVVFAALIPAFWLGGRHGRSVLMKKYK